MQAEVDAAREFLQRGMFPGATNVTHLDSGMFSTAFGFEADGQAYVLRVNAFEEDFRKDEYAHLRLRTFGLPIPKVVSIGAFDAVRAFCITQRCDGILPTDIDRDAARRLMPSLFDALDALAAVDTTALRGWGLTRADGHGRFPSWPHYVLSLFNQKYDMDWLRITAAPFWDARLFDVCYAEMRRLLEHASPVKSLLHGDFAGSNLVAAGDRLTGVLDWAEMRLGDVVADVAYLDYWDDSLGYAEAWREREARRGRDVPRFAERLRCYKLHTALGGLIIGSLLDSAAEYAQEAQRAAALLP